MIKCFEATSIANVDLITPRANGNIEISDIFFSLVNKATDSTTVLVRFQVYCPSMLEWKTLFTFDGLPQGGDTIQHSFNKPFAICNGDGSNARVRLEITGNCTDFFCSGSIIGFWET